MESPGSAGSKSLAAAAAASKNGVVPLMSDRWLGPRFSHSIMDDLPCEKSRMSWILEEKVTSATCTSAGVPLGSLQSLLGRSSISGFFPSRPPCCRSYREARRFAAEQDCSARREAQRHDRSP